MIAAALALQPALLIADEPTTALDVTTQAQILWLIKEIQRTHGMAVLFITHDFGVVAEVADRVVVMQNGLVVEQGTAQAVLKNPQHPYTRMLISSVPSMTPPPRAPRTGAVALQTRGLCKTYRDGGFFQKVREVRAAHEVDILVRRGETLGIVGESGSGKSTVARCIVRLVDPSGGHIEISDRDMAELSAADLRAHRRHVQIVFQDPYRSLNPRRSVGAAILEGPMNFGVSRAEALARARDLMKLVGLDANSLHRYPHQFSGGQRQRIVSALDVSVQAQVLELLDDVRKRFNLAVLFITHDLRVAAQICDRIAVMYKGEVVEHGAAAELFRAPRHDYTKALFNAAPGRDFEFGTFEAA
jgi:peptide/nickel transport system ATP-binding protein